VGRDLIGESWSGWKRQLMDWRGWRRSGRWRESERPVGVSHQIGGVSAGAKRRGEEKR
jgi:hypothetical protein